MLTSFLLMLREGLEAALIIGILLGYLSKIDQKQYFKSVYSGVLAAAAASILSAYAFESLAGGFEGASEQIFEGVLMLFATVILTYMVIWMKNQSRNMKGELETHITHAVNRGSSFGIFALAFVSVLREGVEVVLFMSAATVSQSPLVTLTGAFTGLISAIIIAMMIFKTSTRLNLRQFFMATGGLLLVIAAGMIGGSIHEFQEAALIPMSIEHLYDINGFMNEEAGIGLLLKSLFGYNGNPSLFEVMGYWLYLITAGFFYFLYGQTAKTP